MFNPFWFNGMDTQGLPSAKLLEPLCRTGPPVKNCYSRQIYVS